VGKKDQRIPVTDWIIAISNLLLALAEIGTLIIAVKTIIK
jgi:hypothetical protein